MQSLSLSRASVVQIGEEGPTSHTETWGLATPSSSYQHVESFTQDGSPALHHFLHQLCARVRSGVEAILPPSQLVGLLLAGGYGRGEGGVYRTPGSTEDRPYNDLEFYVFVQGNRHLAQHRWGAALHQLGHQLSQHAQGLEVEFKLLSLPEFSRSPVTMFSYDLVSRHHWLIGTDQLFQHSTHHTHAHSLPEHEATRLLFNRCSGLLYAQERLARPDFSAEDADFVIRNHAKLRLAMGDVILALHGRYHWSCIQRGQRLLALEEATQWLGTELLAAIRTQHPAGIDFKLHPSIPPHSQQHLQQQQDQLSSLAQQLWLKVETRRLQQPYTSITDYALSSDSKCPEQPTWRNLLISLRTFGLNGKPFTYPRERLLRALALLLWTPWAQQRSLLGAIHRELRTQHADLPRLVAAYQTLWHRFN